RCARWRPVAGRCPPLPGLRRPVRGDRAASGARAGSSRPGGRHRHRLLRALRAAQVRSAVTPAASATTAGPRRAAHDVAIPDLVPTTDARRYRSLLLLPALGVVLGTAWFALALPATASRMNKRSASLVEELHLW